MLATAIPDLVSQVRSTNDRITRLEDRSSRSRRSGRSTGRSIQSAASRRSQQAPLIATNYGGDGSRAEYFGNQSISQSSRSRARTATQRSTTSSVAAAAREILGRATNVLDNRPMTAKTTKTILSHRLRHGWGGTLRDGDIVKYAGSKIPLREGHSIESDLATGHVRRRPVKVRPKTASHYAARAPSCRRIPGYAAPHEDYTMNPAPGEAREGDEGQFYMRPEDYQAE